MRRPLLLRRLHCSVMECPLLTASYFFFSFGPLLETHVSNELRLDPWRAACFFLYWPSSQTSCPPSAVTHGKHLLVKLIKQIDGGNYKKKLPKEIKWGQWWGKLSKLKQSLCNSDCLPHQFHQLSGLVVARRPGGRTKDYKNGTKKFTLMGVINKINLFQIW